MNAKELILVTIWALAALAQDKPDMPPDLLQPAERVYKS